MRAIAVNAFKSAAEIMRLPDPERTDETVLVRLSFAGVNPFDWKIADGLLRGVVHHTFPLILGFDGAGTVEFVGRNVKRFKVGDEVFGQFWQLPLGRGTYAEYTTAAEDTPITQKPAQISMAEAAALPIAGMTALQLLEKSHFSKGDTILIVGATGGVGQFLTQLASQQGLQVIATGAQKDEARLRALDATVVVDFTSDSVSRQVRRQFPSGIQGLIDLANDAVGFAENIQLVRPGGVAWTANNAAGEQALAHRSISGGNFILEANPGLIERLGRCAVSGQLKITIEKHVPFDEAIAAIALARKGGARGKTVISI